MYTLLARELMQETVQCIDAAQHAFDTSCDFFSNIHHRRYRNALVRHLYVGDGIIRALSRRARQAATGLVEETYPVSRSATSVYERRSLLQAMLPFRSKCWLCSGHTNRPI